MKRTLIFATLAAMFAVGCQKDFNEPTKVTVESEEVANHYVVPVDQALARLEAELADIYGEGTRAASRAVKSVQTLNVESIAPATRGGEDLDATDLLYIVEFDDNQGSAILGADVRVDEVFAILDESVITEEDFENAAAGENELDPTTFVAGLIADEVMEQMSRAIVLEPLRYHYKEYIAYRSYKREIYVRTKWTQDSPYNNHFYTLPGYPYKAGDTTIATAQKMLNDATKLGESNITIGIDNFSVSLLNQRSIDNIGQVPSVAANNEVADYVALLANRLNVPRDSSLSMGNISDVVTFLSGVGYSSVSSNSGTMSQLLANVKSQIYTNNFTAIMQGSNSSGTVSHTWLLDGYIENHCHVYFCEVEGNTLVSREYIGDETVHKVHCNFGWGGVCDGYYKFGIFSVNYQLDGSDVYEIQGDVTGTHGTDQYNSNLKVITHGGVSW